MGRGSVRAAVGSQSWKTVRRKRSLRMTDQKKDNSSLWRLSGIGAELVGSILGLGLLGYGVDAYFDTDPWGLIVGLMLGMVGGMYNAIQSALAATRPDVAKQGGRKQDARKKGRTP